MNKLFLLCFIIAFQFFIGQNKNNYAEVTALESNQNTLTVNSIGYGRNLKDANANAEKNAFSVLLFKGIPQTPYNIPFISNESEARNANNAYFKKFFEEGYYKTFIMSSIPRSDKLIKGVNGKSLSVDITINCNSLRKDLEQLGLSRKFGF